SRARRIARTSWTRVSASPASAMQPTSPARRASIGYRNLQRRADGRRVHIQEAVMAQYSAEVIWERGDAVFTDNRYSRAHRWHFDGGLEVPASSSPQSVPLPLSDAAA